jgi:hypothetical protein
MKLSRNLSLVGLCLLTAGYVGVTQGCSSSSSSGTTSSVGGAPKKPNAPPTTSKDEHNYAVDSLLLGDTDRSGAASTTAWKKYGFNIDGLASTKDSTDVCTPAKGAGKEAQTDGDNGIDNSFGSRIVPIIQTFSHDISKSLSDSIAKGSFTILLDTVGLSADPAQTNTGLTGQLFAGAKFSDTATPTFTPADNWPVRPEGLNGSDLASGSKVKFADAFVIAGMYVNGNPSDVSLSLAFGGVSLDINIHQATVAFQHNGTKADTGTIAGVINTSELIDGLRKVAGRISDSLCSGSAFDSIAQQIAQASDIMDDGTNRSGVECNAISIGLGFTAKEIAPPSKVADLGAVQPDKCSDGGADDSGSDAGTTDSGTTSDATTD